MKNKIFSLLLIWTILLVSNGVTNISAQIVSKETRIGVDYRNIEFSSDKFKNWLEKELNKPLANVLDTPVNLNKISKEVNQPLPRRKMSGKRKAMWIAIIIGSAVGMFFLIKYAKECEIYESYCQPDEVCPCLKYKDEK
jgi:hypothetical protein